MKQSGIQIYDGPQQQNKQLFIEQDFYLQKSILQIKIRNNIIYIFANNTQMFIIQMITQNRQQKIIKKVEIKFQGIHFMNQTNQFVVTYFSSIKIWKQDHNFNWSKVQTILKPQRNRYVSTLDISQNDELIVYQLSNAILQFWKYNVIWECYLNIKGEWGKFKQLKINKTSDKLIAITLKYISVFNHNTTDEGMNNLEIMDRIEGTFESICFVDENKFISVSLEQNQIIMYEIISNSSKMKLYESNPFQDIQFINTCCIVNLQEQCLTLIQDGKKIFYFMKVCNGNYSFVQSLSLSKKFQLAFSQKRHVLLLTRFGQFDQCLKIVMPQNNLCVD